MADTKISDMSAASALTGSGISDFGCSSRTTSSVWRDTHEITGLLLRTSIVDTCASNTLRSSFSLLSLIWMQSSLLPGLSRSKRMNKHITSHVSKVTANRVVVVLKGK